MKTPHPPSPPDHRPARYVEALYRQWIDPIEVAFADLAARQELDDLRARLVRPAQPSPPRRRQP